MNILTINTGSSSIKTTLFETNGLARCAEIDFKNLNTSEPVLSLANQKKRFQGPLPLIEAFKTIFQHIPASLQAIGHRVVHGGSLYQKSVLVDEDVLQNLYQLIPIAPLHNRTCVEGIAFCRSLFPNIPNVAVFDTTFHHTIPPYAHTYGLPLSLCQKYQIRRYGFHGISHAFLWQTYADYKKMAKGKVITLHLGSGCSVAAIQDGISIDTSMGFTPSEGLLMSTRCGDIDFGILEFLASHESMSMEELSKMLNTQSGLLGISEKTADMKELLDLNDVASKLAVEVFCYRVVKYLGAYIAALQGCDAIIFSGGVGENSPIIRSKIIEHMEWLGMHIDELSNHKASGLKPGEIHNITAPHSSVDVFAIGSDESRLIAQETIMISK